MKIRFHGVGCVDRDTLDRNIAHSKSLGLPAAKNGGRNRLAVIGGGHSILNHVDELRNFDGDRWIIAGAFRWCLENGISGTFFNVDPQDFIADLAYGAEKAIVASCTHPALFDTMKDKDVQVFDLISEGDMINHGSSAATAVPVLSVQCDYREIVFYGCDSSYEHGGWTHAYEDAKDQYGLVVKCNNETFYTTPALLLQAEYLSTMIRIAPHVFKEKSGGFLRAQIADQEYDLTHATRALYEFLGAYA